MKKIVLTLTAVLLACVVWAADFGVMVNGTDYYAGTLNPSALDPSFTEYMVIGVDINQGDKFQVYDNENKAGWAPALNDASIDAFVKLENEFECTATGKYDFYIKLKYGEDQLYIGGEKSASAVEQIEIVPVELNLNEPFYNVAGQQVNANYKGVVIQNGHKFLLK